MSAEELYELGERCAETYMQADALQYEAMVLLVEYHEREGWRDTLFTSTADWLAWRTGITRATARERVRVARALRQLPQTSEAMRTGALSFTKARAITRAADSKSEGALLEMAQTGSAMSIERVVRGWKTMDRNGELKAEELRHRTRTFTSFIDDDGMVVVRGRLDPEVGAALMRAVEAASDALFHKQEPDRAPEEEVDPAHRRADAVGLIAERALAAGFGHRRGGGSATDGSDTLSGDGGGDDGGGDDSDGVFDEAENANAHREAPISGSRAARYQVMLHVDADTLSNEREPGLSELGEGTRVSAETSRRLCCDASVVRVTRGPDGEVLDVGRRTRTIPASLRRALEVRDRGCRFPGCGVRFTDGHHLKHWANGGENDLKNLILLCRRHHRAVHEGGVKVCMDVHRKVAFFMPDGRVFADGPPQPNRLGRRDRRPGSGPSGLPAHDQPPTPDPAPTRLTLRRPLDQVARATLPAHLTGAARYKRDRDIPWEVEARAREALDR